MIKSLEQFTEDHIFSAECDLDQYEFYNWVADLLRDVQSSECYSNIRKIKRLAKSHGIEAMIKTISGEVVIFGSGCSMRCTSKGVSTALDLASGGEPTIPTKEECAALYAQARAAYEAYRKTLDSLGVSEWALKGR